MMERSHYATVVFFILFAAVWFYLRRHKPHVYLTERSAAPEPLPLNLGFIDHCKALISWVFLFMRVFSVRPGLYETARLEDGRSGAEVPVLVTCNNLLSIFLLARRVMPRKVRFLVLDTGGINVWCSAGKGRFSAQEIMDKARRTGLLEEGKKVKLILPKFSLSGVRIADLKKGGIHGIIGPLYASDVPSYLDEGKFEDRIDDRVRFGLKARTFTALPTAVQFLFYFLGVHVLLLGYRSAWIVWSAVLMAFFYPILLPYLPGKQFATKGISMGSAASVIAAVYFFAEKAEASSLLPVALFLFATSIFIALSYTGNSAISNYSKVRKEIARFLPAVIVLYLLAIASAILL